MIGIIVTPMERGQITLPKEYREQLGIVPGMPLNVTLENKRIMVEPLAAMISDSQSRIIKAKYSRREHLQILKKITKHIQKNGPIWTDDDVKVHEAMKKKEKYLNW